MSNIPKFEDLEKTIKINFKNKDLFRQAFVHRSYLNEHPDFDFDQNERLEFLGDAVLELIVTEYLYRNYKNPEGELTNWRAALVKGETISSIAKDLNFEKYLYLSRGEAKGSERSRDLIMANTFEAVIGAIYLDQGFDTAKDFIDRYVIKRLPDILEKKLYLDAKTNLQELAQEKKKVTPRYRILDEWGPDHAREFKVGVFLNEEQIGEGVGFSKQEAEQEAAANALKKNPKLQISNNK